MFERVENRLNQFFSRHKRLDIAYKLIHWSIATFILIVGFVQIMIVAFTMPDGEYLIPWLYGFNLKKEKKDDKISRRKKMLAWLFYAFCCFLIIAACMAGH